MQDRVVRLAGCELRAVSEPWAFAEAAAGEIAEHWRQRSAESPRLFNGTILLMREWRIEGDALVARLSPAEFKSFLFWRETGYRDAGVRDGFGSALIRSREGHVLLGRQSAGNINAGLAYLPGGFIDPRDVALDGRIDITASIDREVREETGLDPATLRRSPGFLVTFCGPLVSIGVEYWADEGATRLRERMLDGIARDPEAELADVLIVRAVAEVSEALVPPYARLLLRHVLPA